MSDTLRMMSRFFCIVALATATSGCMGLRYPPRFGALRAEDQPFQFRHDILLYTADNGMTVALLPDRRTNLVTVDARYRVGASDDPAGRAGLSHLVEHLTFEARTGTDRATLADRLGEAALQHNAFTTHDVTHYMATALAHRLSDVLELEAQRLEMTCAQIDDDVFIRERDVVLEESAEKTTPWSELNLEVSRAVWGEHHPYARGLGTREVADATKDEACRFLGGHYAPNRLMLVVTGDFDPDRVSQAIGTRFARVTRKSDAARAVVQEARLTGTRSRHRADIDDAVALVFFPAPSWGGKDAVLHQLALNRLRGVMAQADEELDWITNVSVSIAGAGRAQLIRVMISVDDPERLDAAVDELFTRAPSMFTDIGPYQSSNMIDRLQTGYVASYESFETRGAWLADYLTYTRHDGFMIPELQALANTSMADADRYARARFVREKSHVALVEPSGNPATATQTEVASGRELDLAPWRAPVDPLEAQRPLPAPNTRVSDTIDEMTLENGLRVVLAPDPTSALVDVRLVFPHGSASDSSERLGRATAAGKLLEPIPDRRYRASDVFLIGWGLSIGTQFDVDVYETSTVFKARGSSNRADWHVWRLYWLIEQCGYLDDSVKTFRDDIIRASADDVDPAETRVRELLFGARHPYSAPLPTGNDWSWLTPAELEDYRERYYVPRGATLIVTGGFEVEAMRQHVRELFEPWRDSSVEPPATVPVARPAPGPSWIGLREPSRTQVGLVVAFATASEPDRDQAARLVLREMVSDRLRIVREGMGASYGVNVAYAGRTGGGALYIESDLEPVRAAKAATAIVSELEVLRTGAGAMAEDFVRARRRALASALADAAGVTAVADELEYSMRRGLPVGHIDQLALAISKVTPAEVATVAAADLDQSRRVVWVSATPERLDGVMAALGATDPKLFDSEHQSEGKEKAEGVRVRAEPGR
ncbi:pitrilysin family protein [Vitiosangium sp. GDMCC 1.1324]|uniref:M16 family metallopeptidase n=1 Tax=Vitiosangium sp. (strain GDMCC 1.1324) TaxID=2138576 RepID=UPI00130EFE76|nr:M16 family metallopeptidase [Vitiosangium sp. GDMCC 1.1324]